ncbi:MAG: glycerol-3-phosphate 1-O-acyltransferase PlsY [Aquificae bacterium]|nr:glycerol-3-phosphate 1-O-acyltransferase PlsY [Aquificota bacterium]
MKLAFLLFTYLIASIPFGYIVGRMLGRDIRKEGSGNIGATNVARTLGKKAGAVVLFLDMLKGFLPVYLAKAYGFDDKFVALVGLTAVVGHCYSVFMGFKGGKGVATGIGVLIALSPTVALIVILLWLGVFLTSGYVSLASVISAAVSWIVMLYVEQNFYYSLITLISSLIIVLKHSSNIDRLIKGTENRFLYK